MNEVDFVIKLGVDWVRVLSYKQSNLTAVDLSGYTARLQVRSSTNSQVKILDLTTANGGIVIDGPTGTLTIHATALQLTEDATHLHLGSITTGNSSLMEDLESGMKLQGFGKIALYDLDIISAGGVITKLLSGKVCFEASITK